MHVRRSMQLAPYLSCSDCARKLAPGHLAEASLSSVLIAMRSVIACSRGSNEMCRDADGNPSTMCWLTTTNDLDGSSALAVLQPKP